MQLNFANVKSDYSLSESAEIMFEIVLDLSDGECISRTEHHRSQLLIKRETPGSSFVSITIDPGVQTIFRYLFVMMNEFVWNILGLTIISNIEGRNAPSPGFLHI
jgi:hypothetical protein